MSCNTPWPSERPLTGWSRRALLGAGLASAASWTAPAWANAPGNGAATAGLAATAATDSAAGSAPSAAPVAAAASPAAPAQLPGSRLQGEATLRFFGLRVYHARLWTLPDFRPERFLEQPVVLELDYLRDLKGGAIAERSVQEMRRAGGFSETQAERWLAEMRRIFPDVKNGDRLTGLHEPGVGARFWHNGQPAGSVTDPAFGRLFFGIWLAPSTSEPAMRLALLGQTANR